MKIPWASPPFLNEPYGARTPLYGDVDVGQLTFYTNSEAIRRRLPWVRPLSDLGPPDADIDPVSNVS